MFIVRHRVNTLELLNDLPPDQGAEIDLRSSGNEIILNHDPFGNGPTLSSFLKHYGNTRRAPLILNSKEDGLEERALELLDGARLTSYFFLDLALPTMVRFLRNGFRKIAVRVSEFEPLELAAKFEGKLDWAWVDCFGGTPPRPETLQKLHAMGFSTMLVSPELQGFGPDSTESFAKASARYVRPGKDGVCTKFPYSWPH